MSTMRLRRLERLERRQARGKLRRDPYDLAMPLWVALEASAEAESAGRPFSWWPPEPEVSPEVQQEFELRMRELDITPQPLRAARAAA
jgi:hypothetical protein